MKKLSFLLIILTTLQIKSQTSIAGGSVNGVWSLAGSPYNVGGSIFIPNGDSLKIQQGVTVNFQGNCKLLVLGKLKALGTVTDTIFFTASNAANGWRGIRFSSTPVTNDSSVIRYCKITYGKANGASPEDNGGAIYLDNFSKVRITNCLISRCMANNFGGAIYCNYSSPLIGFNTIKNNSANGGGGVNLNYSSPVVYNNVITSNTVSVSGGGIWIGAGKPTISTNTISGNTGNGGGGGIFAAGSGHIQFNKIDGNTSGGGGGIYTDAVPGGDSIIIFSNTISLNTAIEGGGILAGGSTTINANVIDNNSASMSGGYGGGGLFVHGNLPNVLTNNFIANNSSANGAGMTFIGVGHLIRNNVICNNQATNGGAVYTSTHVSLTFVNNTFANNRADNGGAIYGSNNATLTLKNCILWKDSASFGNEVYLADEGTDPSFTYCNIKGGSGAFELNGNFYTGTYANNINADPAFVSPAAGAGTPYNGLSANWSLGAGSACLDAGDPTGPYPSTDIAGNNRVAGAFIDIGAYEGGVTNAIFSRAEESGFSVFPNPCKGEFSISGLKYGSLLIEVFDLQGQKMLEKNESENDQLTIDVAGLKAGVYIIKLSNENNSHFRKILIN